jgi:hypothetical protein
MYIFNLRLIYGLSKLGGSAGGLVPMAFMETDLRSALDLAGVARLTHRGGPHLCLVVIRF